MDASTAATRFDSCDLVTLRSTIGRVSTPGESVLECSVKNSQSQKADQLIYGTKNDIGVDIYVVIGVEEYQHGTKNNTYLGTELGKRLPFLCAIGLCT